MAKKYQKIAFELKGFDKFLEKLDAAGVNAEKLGRRCFYKCTENMYDELYEKGKAAGLDEKLLEAMNDRVIDKYNTWFYEVGWSKPHWNGSDAIPDAYKVLFYNYGTPERETKKGYNRGKESAHPEGSHGFIKKAKLAAAAKNKKVQRDTLAEITKNL